MTNKHSWQALTVFTLSYIFAALAANSIGPLAPFLQEELGFTKGNIGLFTASIYLAAALSGIPSGWLADHLGVRKALVIGLVIQAILTCGLLTGLLPWMLLFMFLSGIGYGVVNPATGKGVMVWFSSTLRGTAMAVKQSGFTLGGVLAGVILPPIAVLFGWQKSILTAVGLLFLGAFIAYIFCPTKQDEFIQNKTENENKPNSSNSQPSSWDRKAIIFWSIIMIFFAAVQQAGTTFLVIYLVEKIGYTRVAAGMFFSLALVSGGIGRIAWGWVSDFWFKGDRKKVLIIVGLIAAAMCIILGFVPAGINPVLLGLIVFLFGFTAIGYNAVFLTLVAEVAGKENSGKATGLSLTIAYLGAIFGPPVFGLIVDFTHAYLVAWLIFGGVLALATLSTIFYRFKLSTSSYQ
ncbi:MAG TPA: hypothetical protein DD719_07215 [Desulfotomaculum sp.]|jgi:sugar phosphate permease|nr:hypothetical protein [Desulfotomaculum sp.]HCJ79196.1 hypothetical protein [Desulfotomaculum sp.]